MRPWLPVVQKTNILPSSTPSFAQKYDLSALYSPTLLLWFLFQHAQAITLRTQIVSDMAMFRQLPRCELRILLLLNQSRQLR